MLELKNIVKNYESGETIVSALKGVNITFRENEFVAILGPSGCGKTTMLNIIGGLDKYTSGDLIINGKSTKEYNDHDWDTYRNNTIGFVFQTYNLIPHQSVLNNVELSLTLSGISKAERKQRAIEALNRVGLHDQVNKKPNQLSGGQMQRVAIARAIVNNPKIILADEPTGALDTETSIQVMEILKEIAKSHLVIMVTHNPELAKRYSTRTIKLLDGNVVDDSKTLSETENLQLLDEKEKMKSKLSSKKKEKKVGMSFFTALALSMNNLLTKKARTILTAFAGSIGIIGIALILSLSSGFQNYVNDIEEDTLSTYPLSINTMATDLSSFTEMYEQSNNPTGREEGYIYSNDVLLTMVDTALDSLSTNNLAPFKAYLDENRGEIDQYITDIQYQYNLNMNIYDSNYSTASKPTLLNPFSFSDSLSPQMQYYFKQFDNLINNMEVWQEMMGNQTFLDSQYSVAAGRWPSAYNEMVLVVDENKGINDYFLYAIGMKDASEIEQLVMEKMAGQDITREPTKYSYDDLLGKQYRLLIDTDYYKLDSGIYLDKSNDDAYVKQALIDKGIDLKIVGILNPKEGVSATTISGAVAYTSALSNYIIDYIDNSPMVKAQRDNESVNLLTGTAFSSDPELAEAQLKTVYDTMGVVDKSVPTTINIYPSSFDGKDKVIEFIEKYNAQVGQEDDKIKYSDFIGLLMSSISKIINAISYVLIAFVSISLIVSSIMIGIITYISVLERTKEIGVLRSIGASKHDISRVFNAETLIIGFISGVIGIVITIVLDIPINLIIDSLAGIGHVAKLPVIGAIILVVISTLLTFIAGLIPARMAAKKDPVIALRSE